MAYKSVGKFDILIIMKMLAVSEVGPSIQTFEKYDAYAMVCYYLTGKHCV